jgi:hypothetical protein
VVAQTLRVPTRTPLIRVGSLPGSFRSTTSARCGRTDRDGTEAKVHFIASRLKYSRRVEVSIVPDERVETLDNYGKLTKTSPS